MVKEGGIMELTLNIFLWGYLVAYCIHIVEEYSSGQGFVTMMKKRFWPEYTSKMFFGFNTMLLIFLAIGLVLFDTFGGLWVIWSLSFAFMFVTNGLWHLIQTIVLKDYSPGLATSPIYWVLLYFVTRYFFIPGEIETSVFIISILIGTIITILMFSSGYYQRLKSIKKGSLTK